MRQAFTAGARTPDDIEKFLQQYWPQAFSEVRPALAG